MEIQEKIIANSYSTQIARLQAKIDFCRSVGQDSTKFENLLKMSKESVKNILSGLKYRNLWNEM